MFFELWYVNEMPGVADLTGPPLLSTDLCRKHECGQCDAPQVTALSESAICSLCAPGMESKWKDWYES